MLKKHKKFFAYNGNEFDCVSAALAGYDGMTIGGKTIADVDADPAKTVETVLSALDASALNIRPLLELTGNAAKDAAQVAAAQNKGYGAYQMTERVISMTEK